MTTKSSVSVVGIIVFRAAFSYAQDAMFTADSLKYSHDFYSKVHFVAIVNLSVGSAGETEFKYDRYPNGGPERIQCPSGEFVRKRGQRTWVKSSDWGDTGKPTDAATSGRLNNWVGLVDSRLSAVPALKFVAKRDDGERDEMVFEEADYGLGESRRYVFGKFKNEDTDHPLLSEFSGPMRLGGHDATVKISFSYLVSVKIQDVTESPAPTTATDKPAKTEPQESLSGPSVILLDGNLKIDVPADFVREPDDPAKPKTLAKFSREDGAWGEVLRGTHGLTPDQLDGYLKMRVAEYSKGFKWLPKDSHLQWLKKEIVTIDGRKWADWRFVPMLKDAKDYSHNPVYTRFLTTSYKGQLLEINFTSNLNTNPELKQEIDHIMDSVHLEE